VRALPLLVDAFVQGANIDPSIPLDKRPRKSELHFLASVFANLSMVYPCKLPFDSARADEFNPSPILVVFSFSPRNLWTL
jgi:hypothetical protein